MPTATKRGRKRKADVSASTPRTNIPAVAGAVTSKKSEAASDKNIIVEWKDMFESQWNWNFELLKNFSEREGHTNVPRDHVEKNIYLGKWMIDQRALKKWGELSLSRQERLEALGVVWKVVNWKEFHDDLEAYW
eukprot:CAMPEP_0195302872 /NCGR_PEP_ID=MMETSP0707-20130614/31832_1 /TAXON_ID=33640 /ORGANISM="Asterionellopsis glacialis, Strain CCMP134" /LENGTH=133 /DNA_ID=CAMNT_0040366237 /DNA_START=68 /DNA_END=466 /DNA_ORIENTATION=+